MKNKRGLIKFVLILILLIIIVWLIYIAYQIFLTEQPGFVNSIEKGIEKISLPTLEPVSEQIQEPETLILPEEALPERTKYNLEKETFIEMNKARQEHNLPLLVWDEKIANTAFKHSKDMAENNYVNHTNLQGLNPAERLEKDKILNFCSSENIFYIETENPEKDLPEEAVQGWLKSPRHRENLLDINITRAGVGIYCQTTKCYVTANHICSKQMIIEQLQKNYIYFFPLYPNSSFNIPVQINYKATATQKIDVYIIPNQTQYERYVRRKSFLFTKQYTSIREIQNTTTIQKDYGIMVRARHDAGMQIEIEYV